MKVFLVAFIDYEDFFVLDIYRNKEDAEKRLKKEIKNDPQNDYDIQEYELK